VVCRIVWKRTTTDQEDTIMSATITPITPKTRRSRATRSAAQAAQPKPQAKPAETPKPEPAKPTATIDLGAKQVTFHWPTITLPDKTVVKCSHTSWGHQTEAAARKCARQMAAEHGVKLPAWPVELFTTNYRAWRPGMGSPVVISLSTPRWRPEAATWPRLWEATPRRRYFHADPSEFDRRYLDQLEAIGAQQIARRLVQIARDAYLEPSDRLALCCWETDSSRCHRATFAQWLLVTTGEKVTEVP
jgi:hypothetical protein